MAQQGVSNTSQLTYVPSGFKWSPEAADKERARGKFIRVGGEHLNRRFLSGAQRSFTSNDPNENRTIFNIPYRISGTPEAVRTALQYAGVAPGDIEQVIQNSITKDNYQTTMKQQYDDEIASVAALKKKAKTNDRKYSLEEINWFAANVATAYKVKSGGEAGKTATSPRGRRPRGETIAEKYQSLAEGKVLDVSNIDMQTGSGARKQNRPKTNKSGKYGTNNVRIISNDPEKYQRALELIFGPDAANRFANDIQNVRSAIADHTTANQNTPMPANAFPTSQNGYPPLQVLPNQQPQFQPQQNQFQPPRQPGATLANEPRFTTGVPQIASPPVMTVGNGAANLPSIPNLGTAFPRQ